MAKRMMGRMSGEARSRLARMSARVTRCCERMRLDWPCVFPKDSEPARAGTDADWAMAVVHTWGRAAGRDARRAGMRGDNARYSIRTRGDRDPIDLLDLPDIPKVEDSRKNIRQGGLVHIEEGLLPVG